VQRKIPALNAFAYNEYYTEFESDTKLNLHANLIEFRKIGLREVNIYDKLRQKDVMKIRKPFWILWRC